MIPSIAPFHPTDHSAGVTNNDDLAHFRALLQSVVGIAFEWHYSATAAALIGGNQYGRATIANAAGKAVGREAAEHNRVDRPDPGASRHGYRDFGDHRQVDRDAIALFDASRFQNIGEPAHGIVQFSVGHATVIAGIVALPQNRNLLRAERQVAVDAIIRSVERSVLVPGNMDVAFEGGISHLGKRLDPINTLAVFAPEPIGVGERFPVKPEIIIFPDLAELRMGRDRDYCPAGHGGSFSAGNASPGVA